MVPLPELTGCVSGYHSDSNASTEAVASAVEILGGGCGFSDADSGGTDTAFGFSLTANASEFNLSVTCTLVVGD
jgi:hypothetical protein